MFFCSLFIKTPSRILGTESSTFKTSNGEVLRQLQHLLHCGGSHAPLTSGDEEQFKDQSNLGMHWLQISHPCPQIIIELEKAVRPSQGRGRQKFWNQICQKF